MKIRPSLLCAIVAACLTLPGIAKSASFQTFQPADVVLGQPNFTTSTPSSQPNRFIAPSGVAMDPTTGKVFVSQQGGNRVVRFSSAAAAQSGSNPEAVFGQASFASTASNQGGTATAATLAAPGGIYVDASGNLWVADFGNNRVLKYALASLVGPTNPSADVVLGQPNFTTSTTGTTAMKMNAPYDVTVDANGVLWVADTSNNRVLRFDNAAAAASSAAANGVLGQLLFTTGVGGTTSLTMSNPSGVNTDSSGRLWVADSANNRVLRYDAAATLANGAAASGVLGQPDFTTASGGTTAAKMLAPYGLYADASGNLWVGEYSNARVTRFANAASLAAGAEASLVLGQPNFTSSGSGVTAVNLGGVTHIGPGPGGSLFVTDYANSRVLRYSPIASPAPTPPLISLIGPSKRVTVKSKIVIKGLSGDSDGTVVAVKGNVNSGSYTTAAGTSPWSYTAKLKKGKNLVKVRAIDNSGLTSDFVRVTVTRK